MSNINSGNIAQYACISYPGVNQTKGMKANADGYWDVVVGGFDLTNPAGEYFPMTDAVKRIFEDDFSLIRKRLLNNQLYSEYGHPKLAGLNNQQILQRIAHIEETMRCNFIRSITLKAAKDDQGTDFIAVWANITPAGPYAEPLLKSMTNPDENVAWSVRSFSKPGFYKGRAATILTDVVNYDNVTSPGVAQATQFKTATMQSLQYLKDTKVLLTDEDFRLAEQLAVVSMQSDVADTIRRVRTNMGWQAVNIVKPLSFLDI